jgi:catechol 2,3-dioxygenase-like lactoylglutathione lyase family enzyme
MMASPDKPPAHAGEDRRDQTLEVGVMEHSLPAWRFDHVGLSVADLERSVAFYRTAFGFAECYRFELPSIDTTAAMLRHPSGVYMELFERHGSAPEDRTDPSKALERRGYGHWAVDVHDVDGMFRSLVAAGAIPVWKPAVGIEESDSAEFAFVADPEGNLIELVQREITDARDDVRPQDRPLSR